MRGRVHARRTLKGFVADLRIKMIINKHFAMVKYNLYNSAVAVGSNYIYFYVNIKSE